MKSTGLKRRDQEAITRFARRGGRARAESLTADERSTIARNAAVKRWEKAKEAKPA